MPFLDQHFAHSNVSERLYYHGFGGKRKARFMYGLFSLLAPTSGNYKSRLYDRNHQLNKEATVQKLQLSNRIKPSMFHIIKEKGIAIFQNDTGYLSAYDMVTGTQLWVQRIGTDIASIDSITSIGYDSKRNKIHVRYRASYTYQMNVDGTGLVELTGNDKNKHGLYYAKEDVWFHYYSSKLNKVNGETGVIIASVTANGSSYIPIRAIKDKMCFLVYYGDVNAYSLLLLDKDLKTIVIEQMSAAASFVYGNFTDDLTKMVYITQTTSLPTGQTEYRQTISIYVRSVDIGTGKTTYLYSRSPAETYGLGYNNSVYAGGAILDNNRIAYFQASDSSRQVSYVEVVDLNNLSNVLFTTRGITPTYNVYAIYPTS
ncbi:hypothetical protein ACQKJC_08775 [Priestia koreensis]|uniref:hypothetical protein n=1 Tax=Priestia koreensis TaxID=284581 RepID=UPI003D05D687